VRHGGVQGGAPVMASAVRRRDGEWLGAVSFHLVFPVDRGMLRNLICP
jgi:hypothetical protein